MDEHTTSWGIEPVPERLRVLGLVDQALLWVARGLAARVVVGALLVPALSLRDALLAIVLGGLIGNAMLASAGLIGADARVPGMVLMRAPLGRVGSYAPTVLNTLQCWGWATFELIIIATAAAALSEELIGVGAMVLDARLRRGCRNARADRARVRRSPLHPPLRGVRRARVARVPDLVVALQAALSQLWHAKPGRPHALDRDGPRDRDHRFVGAAPRLHASRATGARRGGAPGSATSWRRPGC